MQFASETTLKRIAPHRLAALVLVGLQRYPKSAISDIHQRIGGEIHPKQVKRTREELTAKGSFVLKAINAGAATGRCRHDGLSDKARRYRTTLVDTLWAIHKNTLISQQLL